MNSASYQTPESKKQEFRKYLEKSGVIDALTKGKIFSFILPVITFDMIV